MSPVTASDVPMAGMIKARSIVLATIQQERCSFSVHLVAENFTKNNRLPTPTRREHDKNLVFPSDVLVVQIQASDQAPRSRNVEA